MKLREFLKVKDYSGKEIDFILGRFVLIGTYSGKKRYDSWKNGNKALSKYLDREVKQIQPRLELNSYAFADALSVIAIFIPDYDITMEEEKARSAKRKDM